VKGIRPGLGIWKHFLQYPTRSDIESFRDRRLRELVRHAYNRVAYYRKLFDEHGVDVDRFRGVIDLARIPITSRQTLQALTPEEIVAEGYNPTKLIQRWSSGSSGQKLSVRRTWFEDRSLAAFRKRAERDVGSRARDRMVRFELQRGTARNDVQWPVMLLQRLGLFRLASIDCLADPSDAIVALRALQPEVVVGFPGAITRAAEASGPEGLHDIGVRLIIAGGEVLTPAMRQQMIRAFGARVYNKYGTIEFDLVAMECPQSGEMHVCDDALILEVLRGSESVGSGDQGEVVVTGLHSRAMPLIRYRVGDVATKGSAQCPCGAPFSTILSVRGRMVDYFPLPDGRLLHPFSLTTPMLEAHSWIRQYQLTQERTDHIVLRVVPWSQPTSPQLLETLRQQYAQSLGPQVTLDIRLLDKLSPEPSGKFRLSRSLVRSLYDEVDWEQVDDRVPTKEAT
jgi:phenylacetate-CoA ligase